jgi:hypothetical protein
VELLFIIFTGKNMELKLILLCCLFSFITGTYTAVMVTKDRGCTVTYSKGNEVHIMTGRL